MKLEKAFFLNKEIKVDNKHLPELSIRVRNSFDENQIEIKYIPNTIPQVNLPEPTQVKEKNMVITFRRKHIVKGSAYQHEYILQMVQKLCIYQSMYPYN